MINLLSPETKQGHRFAKYNNILVQYTLVLFVAIIAMSGLMLYGQSTLSTTKADLQELIEVDQARVESLASVGKDADELAATINTIGTLLDQEVKFSYVLQEIGAIIPSGVTLTGINLSQDTTKPMLLEANLQSAEKAGVLQQNLIESDLFVGADIISVSQGVTPGFKFVGQLQAYFNPDVPLNTLDDLQAIELGDLNANPDSASEAAQ